MSDTPNEALFKLYHRGTLLPNKADLEVAAEVRDDPGFDHLADLWDRKRRRADEREADRRLDQAKLPRVGDPARLDAKRRRAATAARYGFITRDPSSDVKHDGGSMNDDTSPDDEDESGRLTRGEGLADQAAWRLAQDTSPVRRRGNINPEGWSPSFRMVMATLQAARIGLSRLEAHVLATDGRLNLPETTIRNARKKANLKIKGRRRPSARTVARRWGK